MSFCTPNRPRLFKSETAKYNLRADPYIKKMIVVDKLVRRHQMTPKRTIQLIYKY